MSSELCPWASDCRKRKSWWLKSAQNQYGKWSYLSLVGWTPWEQLWAVLTAGSRSAVESDKFLLCTGTPSLFSMTSWSRWWMHTGMEFLWACWAVVSPPGRNCWSDFMCTFPYSRVKPAIFDLLLAVCIAAYLGVAYVAVQVRDTDVLFSLEESWIQEFTQCLH